jgi:hypothetical protein
VNEEPEPEVTSKRPFRLEGYPDPLPKYRYSRTRGGVTSHALLGRILWTVVLCVLPFMWLAFSMFPAAVIWAVIAWPLALVAIWKKIPYVPDDPLEKRPS